MTDHDTTRRMVEAFCQSFRDEGLQCSEMLSALYLLETEMRGQSWAAAFTAAEAARWQPIKTAPRDGTSICGLGFFDALCWIIWDDAAQIWRHLDGRECNMHVVYWRPLPPLPITAQQRQGAGRELPPGPSVEGGR
jgi:hypothetical protein